jgi:NAD(P)-dependent dehydrogenase (short-subunit alcohol dehydrogenase family)
MTPQPEVILAGYRGAGWLADKVAIITGGDSGIGRSVAVAFSREGADVGIVYLDEHDDALETKRLVEAEGRRAETIAGDIGDKSFATHAVDELVARLGKLDVLVNNAAEQHLQPDLTNVSEEQLVRTFRTNIFGMVFVTQAVLSHLHEGAAIVNTTSVTAYQGSASQIDYASTKGAILAFTRSLAESLVARGIRVNCVAPGPIWTPLIPASYDADKAAQHGANVPMKRAGQPSECAPAYVYLASRQSSYVSGQTIHVNGGEIVNG